MFIEKFISRFGSIQCPDLLGYNMAIPEEFAESKRVGAAKKVCPELVRGAAEILEEMLNSE